MCDVSGLPPLLSLTPLYSSIDFVLESVVCDLTFVIGDVSERAGGHGLPPQANHTRALDIDVEMVEEEGGEQRREESADDVEMQAPLPGEHLPLH